MVGVGRFGAACVILAEYGASKISWVLAFYLTRWRMPDSAGGIALDFHPKGPY